MRTASHAHLALPPSKKAKKHNNNDEQLQCSAELVVIDPACITKEARSASNLSFNQRLWENYAFSQQPMYEENWPRVYMYAFGLDRSFLPHSMQNDKHYQYGRKDAETWSLLLSYARSLEY